MRANAYDDRLVVPTVHTCAYYLYTNDGNMAVIYLFAGASLYVAGRIFVS